MNINWYGQSCFQISSNQSKNNHVSTLIDPFEESIGLRLPRKLEADVVLITHNHFDHNNVKAVSGQPFIASCPGEYDIKGIFIQGIPAFHDNVQGKERGRTTIYTIEAEEIKLCHLGDLGQKELTAEQLDKIGDVDILMIPIGGFFTIDAQEAVKIMAQIEPKIIIPMHYRIPNLKIYPVKSAKGGVPLKAGQFNWVKLDGLDKFLKIVGVKKIEPLSKFSIKVKDLPKEEVKIIVLQP